jgi:hypothetical protein
MPKRNPWETDTRTQANTHTEESEREREGEKGRTCRHGSEALGFFAVSL